MGFEYYSVIVYILFEDSYKVLLLQADPLNSSMVQSMQLSG